MDGINQKAATSVPTVMGVEDDLIRFKLEPPKGACPGAGTGCEEPGVKPRQSWWELN